MVTPILVPFFFEEYVEHAGFLDDQPVFALADGQVRLFNDQGEQTIEAHNGLTTAALSHDGKMLITGGEDGRVIAINAQCETQQLGQAERKWIGKVATGPKGAVAWTAGRDTFVYSDKVVWGKTADNGHSRQFTHKHTPEDLAFAPKGLRIAIARYNGADLHWVGTQATPESLEWSGPHHLIKFSPDGRFLVTSMQDNVLHGWRLDNGAHMRMAGYPTKVKNIDFSAFTAKSGKWLATAGANSAVLWPYTGSEGPMGKMPKELGQRADSLVTCVACHPEDAVVAIGYADGMVGLVSIEDEKDALLRRPGEGAVTSMGWDMAGLRLAFGTQSGEGGMVDISG
ncbi:MAG: WD40 repeat domain-containing protein [Pseudomonadota bacterium]